jgi:hypothetical protein
MPVEGRDLSSRQTQYVVKDLEIGQPINSAECSETADGVARESKLYPFEKCRNFYFLVAVGGEADIRSSWRDFAP